MRKRRSPKYVPFASASSALFLAFVCGSGIIVARQQSAPGSSTPTRSVRDGVYSVDQAERGRAIVEQHCVECHGESLAGQEGSALVGPAFLLKRADEALDRLFKRVQDTMPRGRVDSVSAAEKMDAIAYILQANGFPSGAAPLLQSADALSRILFPGRTGPMPVGTIVRTIGCLARTTGNEWVLNRATAVEATTLDAGGAADVRAAADRSPGTGTIPLRSIFPSPDSHVTHKMEARGLLLSEPAGAAINVVSLTMLSESCP